MKNEEGGQTAGTGPRERLARAHASLCRWVPPAAVLCFLAWSFISLRSDFSWDDADPEVLNQAWRLARGESIYRSIDTPPYSFAAYPPVYFALTAVLLKLTGLSFLPARILSLLAALAISWGLVRLNREWNGGVRGGIWTSLLLFLTPAFLYNSTRSNVAMAAVAFSLWSFILFLRGSRKEKVILSPLLAVLAFYTKQTQAALPLAAMLYLVFRNRRLLVPYAATLAAAGLIPFLWLQKITDGRFFLNVFRFADLDYSVLQIPGIFLHHAGPLLPFIGFALWTSWRRFQKGSAEPLDFYTGFVLLTTLVSLGRVGAHGQYVLELLVVSMLCLLRVTRLPAIRGREVLASIQILILLLYTPLFVFLEEGLWDIPANRAAGEIYALLAEKPGPIVSQQGSFALFARGEIYIQLFHFTALARAGLWDQNLLLRDIAERKFPFVITEFPMERGELSENARERFTPEMLESLRSNYRPFKVVHPYHVYVPRQMGNGAQTIFPSQRFAASSSPSSLE